MPMSCNRREFLNAASAATLRAAQTPARRPNILLITDDQHNARNLGCYGDRLVKTPNLDRLAARGVRFTRAYSQSMICAPARISMATGQYVHSHGYYGNWGPIPDRPVFLTSHLRRHGYQTAGIGKLHFGYEKIAREFDYHRLCDRADIAPDNPFTSDYFRLLVEKGRPNDQDVVQSARRGTNVPFRSLLPKELSLEWWTADSAIDFLRQRDKSKPFLAMVGFLRPHAPITPPAPYDTMYDPATIELPPSADDAFRGKPPEQLKAAERSAYPYHPTDKRKLQEIMAMYFGLITLIDYNIGRILEELDRQGLTDNTVVIFAADHGDFSGEHGFFHKNLGMYEAIHRIPYIVAGPGFARGQVRDDLVEQVDIFPTVCDAAGVPVPETVQGRSLKAGGPPRKAAFAEIEERKCIRTERYRMVFDPAGKANELYDHAEDPWELENRYDNPKYREARSDLLEEFMRFYARTEQQTIVTSQLPKKRQDAPRGPTYDIWWDHLDWEGVKKKYGL
jgi:arylsulfatase A-like enzyme